MTTTTQTTTRTITVEAGWANPSDRGRHFSITMACGHVESRWMKPSLAQEIITKRGSLCSDMACAECRTPSMNRLIEG